MTYKVHQEVTEQLILYNRNEVNMIKVLKTLILINIAIGVSLANANELIITKSFTGGWHDPGKNGQGFLLEIIRSNNQKKALTTWFTFDTNGNQYWLIGVGEIQEQSIRFEMLLPQGGKFGDAHDPSNMSNTYWGDVTFTFTDCNNGSVNWEPEITGFNSGSMQVIRTTAINNLNCTGGLFDELGDSITDSEVITPLLSSGVDNDAHGKTKYEQRTDRIDYSVEIEDLPLGVYQLFVGDVLRGEIVVATQNDGSTEGEIEFRDPVEPGKFALDFDPRSQIIDIIKNNVIYLTSDGSNGGNNGGNTSQDAPPFGNSETEIYMVNTGVFPLGQAKTKLEQRSDRVDFQVELKDVPVGFYDFNVNEAIQGVIEVNQTVAGLEGELEFRNPVEAGKELLDFNPLGQPLSVTQGATVLFTLDFPATSGAGNDNSCDNGSNNDDCDDDDNDCENGSNNDDCDDDNNLQLVEIERDFNNTGINNEASGSVKYEVRSDRRDFKVEIEDLDFGTYQLVVGGTTVASFNLNDDEVELEFRDPVEPDKLALDFDPLNQLIEIKQSGTVYLSVVLQ